MTNPLALELTLIKEEGGYVVFFISHQTPHLYHIFRQKYGSDATTIEGWTFYISGHPQLDPGGRVLYVRGSDRSRNKMHLVCPKKIWKSLLKAVEELNKAIGPLQGFEDQFFQEIPQ